MPPEPSIFFLCEVHVEGRTVTWSMQRCLKSYGNCSKGIRTTTTATDGGPQTTGSSLKKHIIKKGGEIKIWTNILRTYYRKLIFIRIEDAEYAFMGFCECDYWATDGDMLCEAEGQLRALSTWQPRTLTLWSRNYFFFLILAQPVYKMWIIQEPNNLALWNKLHFEEKKTESIEHV